MKTRSHALWLAAALAAASWPAVAADPNPASAAASAVERVRDKAKAVALCEACGVVQGTRTEKRKGKASGVGAAGGAVAGGVIGNKTTDSTVGTVGGAVIGGVVGNAIEKRVKRTTVWITTVQMKDGTKRDFEATADPKWANGTVVEVGSDGQLKRR